MTEPPDRDRTPIARKAPHATARAQDAAAARAAREAAALRANLHRRKAQLRAQEDRPAPARGDDDGAG